MTSSITLFCWLAENFISVLNSKSNLELPVEHSVTQVLTRAQIENVKISENDICHCRQYLHCWAHQCDQDHDQQVKAASSSFHESKYICSSSLIWSYDSSNRTLFSSWNLNMSCKRDSYQMLQYDFRKSCLTDHSASEKD